MDCTENFDGDKDVLETVLTVHALCVAKGSRASQACLAVALGCVVPRTVTNFTTVNLRLGTPNLCRLPLIGFTRPPNSGDNKVVRTRNPWGMMLSMALPLQLWADLRTATLPDCPQLGVFANATGASPIRLSWLAQAFREWSGSGNTYQGRRYLRAAETADSMLESEAKTFSRAMSGVDGLLGEAVSRKLALRPEVAHALLRDEGEPPTTREVSELVFMARASILPLKLLAAGSLCWADCEAARTTLWQLTFSEDEVLAETACATLLRGSPDFAEQRVRRALTESPHPDEPAAWRPRMVRLASALHVSP